MRACGACFYGRFPFGSEEGECWNRPPIVIAVPQPADAEGRINVEILSVRPTTGRSEYCYYFAHRTKRGEETDDGEIPRPGAGL